MNDKIITYIIKEIAIEPIECIDINEDLFGNGIVDSLGMMQLIVFLEKEFQVKISPEDLTVENFNSVQSITDFISKL